MEKFKKLIVFHPSRNLVQIIDDLFKKIAPNILYENLLVPDLLDRAIRDGLTLEIEEDVEQIFKGVPVDPETLIFCTCSTIGEIAEDKGRKLGLAVIRIDRPMCEKAVALGQRVGIVAALESTFEPTRKLLQGLATKSRKNITIKKILCKDAWRYKQNGDEKKYISEIVRCLFLESHDLDVIVLAQGSMAPAKDLCQNLGVPILESLHTGVETVAKMMKNREA